MEGTSSKTNYRINQCTHRRLNIEHEFDEHLRKQTHLSNLQFYKYRQELFNRKLNHLRKCLENLEPYETDDTNDEDEEPIMAPNCSIRIQNQFRLLNFSSDTEKRLLGQTPLPNKPSKQLPNISQKRTSIDLNQSFKRLPKKSESHSTTTTNEQSPNNDIIEQNNFQSYINQHINDEQRKQIRHDQRKDYLLKEFDQLKHTIDDPNNTISVLAALSRALLFLDSATE